MKRSTAQYILVCFILSNIVAQFFSVTNSQTEGHTVNVRLLDLTSGLIILGMLLVITAHTSRFPLTSFNKFLIAFGSLALVSTIISFFLWYERFSGREQIRVLLAIIRLHQVLILGYLIGAILRPEYLLRTIRFLLAAVTMLALYSLLVYATSPIKLARIAGAALASDQSGVIGNAEHAGFNETGALFAVMLLTAFAFFLQTSGRRRLVFAAMATLLAVALLLTMSRSAIVAAMTGFIMLGIMQRRDGRMLMLWLAFIGAAVVFLFFPEVTDLLVARVNNTFQAGNTANRSLLTRFESWTEAWNIFMNNPLTGVGYAAFRNFSSHQMITAESYYLEILADMGIIGLGLFIWFIACTLGRQWSLHWHSQKATTNDMRLLASILLPGTVALLTSCITGNNLFDPGIMLLFLFFAAATEISWREAVVKEGHKNAPGGLGFACS